MNPEMLDTTKFHFASPNRRWGKQLDSRKEMCGGPTVTQTTRKDINFRL